jgi:acetoin utilization deacetylase AcuC-like enzyme
MTTAYITHPRYTEHHLAGHPEHAGRIRAIWKLLDDTGLSARMHQHQPEMVSEDHILTVHSSALLETMHWMEDTQQGSIYLDNSTYADFNSYSIARLAAGGVLMATDEVLSGRADNALAVVRPPGHHAMRDHAMGFCILGNVPIAVRHAQKHYGIKRVMVVDYDVHHGNGTEAMFYEDPDVLFISTHQYPFYPGTGDLTDIGNGEARGTTINIPLSAGHSDESFAAIYEQVVWPAARRFQPEVIFVSAGFDSHWTDPLASMRLSLTGYAHLTRELIRVAAELCGGKIIFALEGGYHLDALSYGIANIAHALLGDDTVLDPLGKAPTISIKQDVKPLISRLRHIHNIS